MVFAHFLHLLYVDKHWLRTQLGRVRMQNALRKQMLPSVSQHMIMFCS